jgi:hypothetical protein
MTLFCRSIAASAASGLREDFVARWTVRAEAARSPMIIPLPPAPSGPRLEVDDRVELAHSSRIDIAAGLRGRRAMPASLSALAVTRSP